MRFGKTSNTVVPQDDKGHNKLERIDASRSPLASGLKRIMQRSRLSEEDLELLRLDIIKAHKKKHSRVLAISALLFISLGLLLYYLIF